MIRIYPHNRKSKGARQLSKALGVLRHRPRETEVDTLINWGSTDVPVRARLQLLNDPLSVKLASNKRMACLRFAEHDVPAPRFTTERAVAETWLEEGTPVVARTVLNGHGGAGIRIIAQGMLMPQAPLYTEYVRKTMEYRVHVVDGVSIDVTQKRKRQEVPNDEVNYQVRNHENGWVYCRDNVECPAAVLDAAIQAVRALGLVFGAADVGYHAPSGRVAVYEVNTAPGIEGTTVDKYAEALLALLPILEGGAYARRRTA